MLPRFFIDRPMLAWVISTVIILLGAISARSLPVADYEGVTPPTVRVTVNLAGNNVQMIAGMVAAHIEQQVVGVEGMLYMAWQSNNDRAYSLDVTFALRVALVCLALAGMDEPWSIHTTATFTQWIGGSESNRQFHSSPPSRPIHSCPVVVPK